MRYSYWVENGELWVWDTMTNEVMWHDKPGGETVLQVIGIPDQEDCIALLNYRAGLGNQMYGRPRNLVRCQPNGDIVWQIGGPDTVADVFTEIHWTEKALVAFSWSCYSCTIDVDTGQFLDKVFTK